MPDDLGPTNRIVIELYFFNTNSILAMYDEAIRQRSTDGH